MEMTEDSVDNVKPPEASVGCSSKPDVETSNQVRKEDAAYANDSNSLTRHERRQPALMDESRSGPRRICLL